MRTFLRVMAAVYGTLAAAAVIAFTATALMITHPVLGVIFVLFVVPPPFIGMIVFLDQKDKRREDQLG